MFMILVCVFERKRLNSKRIFAQISHGRFNGRHNCFIYMLLM